MEAALRAGSSSRCSRARPRSPRRSRSKPALCAPPGCETRRADRSDGLRAALARRARARRRARRIGISPTTRRVVLGAVAACGPASTAGIVVSVRRGGGPRPRLSAPAGQPPYGDRVVLFAAETGRASAGCCSPPPRPARSARRRPQPIRFEPARPYDGRSHRRVARDGERAIRSRFACRSSSSAAALGVGSDRRRSRRRRLRRRALMRLGMNRRGGAGALRVCSGRSCQTCSASSAARAAGFACSTGTAGCSPNAGSVDARRDGRRRRPAASSAACSAGCCAATIRRIRRSGRPAAIADATVRRALIGRADDGVVRRRSGARGDRRRGRADRRRPRASTAPSCSSRRATRSSR